MLANANHKREWVCYLYGTVVEMWINIVFWESNLAIYITNDNDAANNNTL